MTIFRHICNALSEGRIHLARMDRFAVEPNLTRYRLYQSDHGICNGRCAGALQSDESDALSRAYRKAHVLQSADSAEAQRELRDVEQGVRHPTKDYIFARAVDTPAPPGSFVAGGSGAREVRSRDRVRVRVRVRVGVRVLGSRVAVAQ